MANRVPNLFNLGIGPTGSPDALLGPRAVAGGSNAFFAASHANTTQAMRSRVGSPAPTAASRLAAQTQKPAGKK